MKLTKEQIEAMKTNEKPLALCPEWMQKAFREYNKIPMETIMSSGEWAEVPITANRWASSTYRLRADYELPTDDKPQFDQIELPTEYVSGQLFSHGVPVSNSGIFYAARWYDIVAYVYHTEAQGRVVSICPRLFSVDGYAVYQYQIEDSTIIDPIAVICRRKKDVD